LKRVLIADDDEVVLELLEEVLSSDGYEVVRARDGHEALDALRAGSIRMVVSDWTMPGMNGIELCRRIRAGDFGGYVYFILLTSRSDQPAVLKGLAAGADDFITKPFDAPELLMRLGVGRRILSVETRHVAIFAMAKLAESRDTETGEHLERVRSYSRQLALELSKDGPHSDVIDREYVENIYLTSPLHDIGKVGIPDSVLLKPGRLTKHEFDIMKTHTTIGARTLEAALEQYPDVQYLRFARDIVLTHHERFDGTGYPRGLGGQEIPLSSRIVALADVYDALRSRRPYKDAYSHEAARKMIVDGRGTQFDPDVVGAFVASESDFLAIREVFDDEGVSGSANAGGATAASQSGRR
jgi:putative two-component system response regulator